MFWQAFLFSSPSKLYNKFVLNYCYIVYLTQPKNQKKIIVTSKSRAHLSMKNKRGKRPWFPIKLLCVFFFWWIWTTFVLFTLLTLQNEASSVSDPTNPIFIPLRSLHNQSFIFFLPLIDEFNEVVVIKKK